MIRTKAAISVEELGDQYCLIGPYNESCVKTEVELLEPTHNEAMMKAIQQMRDNGVKARRENLLSIPKNLINFIIMF